MFRHFAARPFILAGALLALPAPPSATASPPNGFLTGPEATPAHTVSKLLLHRPAASEPTERSRFMVVFEAASMPPNEIAESLRRDYAIELLDTWHRALSGAVIECELAVAERLSRDPRIRVIEQDIAIDLGPRRVASVAPRKGHGSPPSCFEDSGDFRPNSFPNGGSMIAWGAECPNASGCDGNWGLDRIDSRVGLDGLFAPVVGASTVDVFVIDSGVALDHVELTAVQAVEVDVADSNLAPDPHGSHVAGIAVGSNVGVARSPIRLTTLNIGSEPSISLLIEAFEMAVAHRQSDVPAVITMSINDSSFPMSRVLAQVVRQAMTENMVVVNSAGNITWTSQDQVTCTATERDGAGAEDHSLSGTLFPQEVIIVGASADDDRLYCECGELDGSSYPCASRTGRVDLYAPGADIVSMSAVDRQALCRLSGTSMAAPHVAGAAALLLSRFPEASPSAIERALIRMSTRNQLVHPGGSAIERNRLLYVGPYTSTTPVAGSHYVFAHAGETLHIAKSDLIADDFDWEHRSLYVTQVFGASPGSTLIDRGSTIEFTVSPSAPPSRNHYQSAYFRYTMSNGLATDSALLRVVVLAQPTDDTVIYGGTGAADIDLATLLLNDNLTVDEADCLPARTTATAGSVSLRNEDEACVGYRYQPPSASFSGTDSFDYVLALKSGGQVSGRVVLHYNDPMQPAPISGPALVNYPSHPGQGAVEVPVGAYLIAWPASEQPQVDEYELIETDRQTGQTTILYRGPRTFYAVSGHADGVFEYRVRACTPLACSEPSPLSDELTFANQPKSVVDATLVGCEAEACSPLQGLWYDPARPGNGIDLQLDASGRWQILFFTYRHDETPIWYRAQPAFVSGRTLVAALEQWHSPDGLLGTNARAEPFGFLRIDFQSTTQSTLEVFRFDDPPPGSTGYEQHIFSGNFRHLAGANGAGAEGPWRPPHGASWGLTLTTMPLALDGSTTAYATTYFFRPDGSPTWVSTQSGTRIAAPFSQYSGWIQPLYRLGENLCLDCTGSTAWHDTTLGFTIRVDIPNPFGTTGAADISVPIPPGTDPSFPAGYALDYHGALTKGIQ